MEELFTEKSLQMLYDAVSANDGVSVARLHSLVGEFRSRGTDKADLQAYREGRKRWKKLHDEVVPVEHFLSRKYPDDARVRFPLDDKPPDAWISYPNGEPVGIEVTAAMGRVRFVVGKSLAEGKLVPAFYALQDDAPQEEFDRATARGRCLHSPKVVNETIDQAITTRLNAKDKEKFAGQILLITAPIGSSPDRSVKDLEKSHAEKARALPFAEVFVMDGSGVSNIVQLK